MIFRAFLACVVVGAILGVAEVLWRKKYIQGEIARKFIHILAGTFVAFLPFWLDYGWVALLAVGAIALSLTNHYHRIFRAGLSVRRKSLGDLLLAVAIFICAVVQPDKWVFAAAILHVALADGFAAVAGIYLGEYHGVFYKVLKHQKSAIGSATFALISFLLFAMAVILGHGFLADTTTGAMLIVLPVITTLTEAVGIYGLDNLLLPIVVLFSLQALQHVA